MDPALLREREAFKRRALAQPALENKKTSKVGKTSSRSGARAADFGAQSQSAKAKLELAQMKSMSSGGFGSSSGVSQLKFGVLAKIVRHMKVSPVLYAELSSGLRSQPASLLHWFQSRYMERMDHPLTLEEILDETKQLDVSNKVRVWLQTDALKDNPKILCNQDGTYEYKPPFNIKKKTGLLRLLRQYDHKGCGGIFLEDIQESLPNCDKIIRNLTEEKQIVVVTRQIDKKKVRMYSALLRRFIFHYSLG